MNQVQVLKVVQEYEKQLTAMGYAPSKYEQKSIIPSNAAKLSHASWMCTEIPQLDSLEKQMRWLGFLQGVLWSCHVHTIDEMREHNRGG